MTITPVFLCGGECGDIGINSGRGTEHWSAIVNAGAISISTSVLAPGGSERSIRFNPAAAATTLEHTFSAAIASPGDVGFRVKIRFETILDGTSPLFQIRNGGAALGGFRQNAGRIEGSALNSAHIQGPTIVTGQYYIVEGRIVSGATATMDLWVDGSYYGQASVASSAQGATSFRIGNSTARTGEFFIDDLIIYTDGAEAPVGNGVIVGLYPNACGTHSFDAGNDFRRGGSAVSSMVVSETTSWADLQNPLSQTPTTTYLTMATVNTAEYLEHAYENLPGDVVEINGVQYVATTVGEGGSSSPNASTIDFYDGATFLTSTDGSTQHGSVTIRIAMVNPGSSSMNEARVNALKTRWRAGSDNSPRPQLHGQMFEVDYKPTPPPSIGYVKVWNGSAWVLKPAKVWDGSGWVQKPVKVWDGGSWVSA